MSYVIFVWLASVLFGLVVIGSKITAKHAIQNPWLFNFLWSISVLGFTIVAAVANGVGLPVSWGSIAIVSIFSSIVWILFVIVLYKLDSSVISPLFNLRTPITVVLSSIFLGEVLTSKQYGLIVIITLSGLLVAYNERLRLRAFFQLAVAICIVTIFLSSLSALFMKPAITINGYWEATLWTTVMTQVFLLATVTKFRGDLGSVIKNASWRVCNGRRYRSCS